MKDAARLTALFILLISISCSAAGLTGEVLGGVQLEWERGLKLQTQPTSLLLVYEKVPAWGGKAHLSAKMRRDWRYNESEIGLSQAFFSGYTDNVDYCLGLQTINWGTAVGFNPTDYFNSSDISGAAAAGDLSGTPLWAGQISYYMPRWSAAAVLAPIFKPRKLDYTARKIILSALPRGSLLISAIENTPVPKDLGESLEFALRLETQAAGFDIQASYFSGCEALPGLELALNIHPLLGVPTKAEIVGKYRRRNFIGLAAAGTLGTVGVWGEAAFGGPEPFEKSTDPQIIKHPLAINEKYLSLVLGRDYTLPFGRGLLTQLQYIYQGQGSLFSPYAKPNGILGGAHYLYGLFSCDFIPGITGSVLFVHGLTEKSGLLRPALTYNSYQGLQVELSAVKMYGSGAGEAFRPLTSLALKYVF